MPKPTDKPLIDKVFDGCDEMFDGIGDVMDRMFGPGPRPSMPKWPDPPAAKSAATRDIRIKVSAPLLTRLLDGEELTFKVGDQKIMLVRPAKYTRQEVCDLLEKGEITGDRAQEMLRERL